MAKHTPPIECVDVGDRVTVTYRQGDVTITASGKVAVIERRGFARDLRSPEGVLICTYRVDAPRQVSVAQWTPYQPRNTRLAIDELSMS